MKTFKEIDIETATDEELRVIAQTSYEVWKLESIENLNKIIERLENRRSKKDHSSLHHIISAIGTIEYYISDRERRAKPIVKSQKQLDEEYFENLKSRVLGMSCVMNSDF